jgi:CBS domain containing-hemolysin-like protein
MNDWLGIGIGILLTIGTGMFVAAEFSLVNLDRHELEAREERGETGLRRIIDAVKITSTHLSSAQLGITLTTLLAGYTFEPAISSLLRDPLTGLGMSESTARGVGAFVAIATATLFSMIAGELIPKNFALALPLATAKAVIPFQSAFTSAFKPLIVLFNSTANRVVRALGIEPKEELSGARSAEELSALVRHSALAGALDQDQAVLLRRSLEFADYTADEVMTPRVRMSTVERDSTAAEIVRLSSESGHSRFPVTGENIDDIVGLVHVKHAFAVPTRDWERVTAGELMGRVVRVPDSIGVDALLGELRTNGSLIAVVVDEYGGTAGVVTLEDLVEELVGELEDEHEVDVEVIQRNEDSLVFPAALRPDELFERTGIEVPDDGDYETIGGYIAEQLERIPEVGDEVVTETGTLRVVEVDGARVEQIEYFPSDVETDPAFDSAHDRLIDQIQKDAFDG